MPTFPPPPDLSNLSPEDAASEWVDWWEKTYLSLHHDMLMQAEKKFLDQIIAFNKDKNGSDDAS